MESTITQSVICSTCMEAFVNSDTISVTMCGHVFHQNCIQEWRQRCLDCPQCRSPTTNIKQVFLTFDDNNSKMKVLEQQLKSCETTIAKINEDLEKSEINFMQLQQQYTAAGEEIIELKNKLRADNWESDFYALQQQYTEAEETIAKLLTQLDTTTKNDNRGQEKTESISTIYWAGKIDVLEQKLNNTRDLLYKEIEINTNLSSENAKLKSLVDQYGAESQEKEKAMMDKKEKQFESVKVNDFGVVIRNYPAQLIREPLVNNIIELGFYMDLKLTNDDISDASVMSAINKGKVSVFVQFKTLQLKVKFLRNKEKVKKTPIFGAVRIFEHLSDDANSLLHYANQKLKGHGYQSVYALRGKIMAIGSGKPFTIYNKEQVDELLSQPKINKKVLLNSVKNKQTRNETVAKDELVAEEELYDEDFYLLK